MVSPSVRERKREREKGGKKGERKKREKREDKCRNGPVIMAMRFAARPVTRFRNIRHFYGSVPGYFAQSRKIAVSLDSPTQNVVPALSRLYSLHFSPLYFPPLSPLFPVPLALIPPTFFALILCLSVSLASLLFVSLSRSLASLFTLTALNYVKNKFGPGN